jgi:hypothetical protein
MFVTWRHEYSDPGPEDLVEETLACTDANEGQFTMERRYTHRSGSTYVEVARFRRDGTPIAAWRGPSGGLGTSTSIVDPEPPDPEKLKAEVRRLEQSAGLPETSSSMTQTEKEEFLETPAGRIRCVYRRLDLSCFLGSSRLTTWFSLEPLPFDPVVRELDEWSANDRRDKVLVAYGLEGAKATLQVIER